MDFQTVGLVFGTSCLLIHEADAIRRHEWRLFYGLNRLEDDPARIVFQLLHLPLYAVILYYGFVAASPAFTCYYAWFLVLHLLAHVLFLRHSKNEFVGVESWLWIVGAALGGAIYLVQLA